MYFPALPNSGVWVGLVINCTWENKRCSHTHALLSTNAYTQREIPVTLTVNAKATHAVVQFLDGSGSVITFHAIPGQQQTVDIQQTAHGEIVDAWDMPLRFIYSTTWNYAYATGTILGQTFDTREMPEVDFSWVQIVARFTKWLNPPAPTLQPAAK
jgi:hypothetical protein